MIRAGFAPEFGHVDELDRVGVRAQGVTQRGNPGRDHRHHHRLAAQNPVLDEWHHRFQEGRLAPVDQCLVPVTAMGLLR